MLFLSLKNDQLSFNIKRKDEIYFKSLQTFPKQLPLKTTTQES